MTSLRFILITWTVVTCLVVACVPATPESPATTPTPTPPPPLRPANPRIWRLIQPIDAAVRQYLASSNPRSPEALDALARELAEKYRENLELIREEIARTREMPELTDEEKERLDFITVREHIHKVLQEMRMQELRRDSRVTIVVQMPFVVTPPASPTSPTGAIFPTARVSAETPTSTPAPSLPTPTRPAYPPATTTPLPTVDTADCSTVEHIPSDSPMMQEIREDLMPAILARVAPDIRTYNPDFEEIRSIDRVGEWVLLQSRFTKALEPAIFLLRATPSGYRLVAL